LQKAGKIIRGQCEKNNNNFILFFMAILHLYGQNSKILLEIEFNGTTVSIKNAEDKISICEYRRAWGAGDKNHPNLGG
jgi:hypothetical protein